MAKITMLYETDHNHTRESKTLIGVFTSQTKLRNAVEKIIEKDWNDNKKDILKSDVLQTPSGYFNYHFGFLFLQNQTQGLGSYEIVLETLESNKLLIK